MYYELNDLAMANLHTHISIKVLILHPFCFQAKLQTHCLPKICMELHGSNYIEKCKILPNAPVTIYIKIHTTVISTNKLSALVYANI